MEKDILQKIVEAANLAPSGGNSQPWKFAVQGERLLVTALPGKDHPVFNYRGRGTLIAHGAMLENIRIAATACGYRTEFTYSFSPNVVTTVVFVPEKKNGDISKLYAAIPERHSNRTRYKERVLTEEEHRYIFAENERFADCRVVILSDKKDRLTAAQQLAHDTPINFGNKKLHRLAYKELVWTREEETLRGGLYAPTLEIDEKQEKPVKLMGKWPVAIIFRSLGLFKKMYQANVLKGASGSVIGLIAVPDTDEAFMHAGQMLQNIWLRSVSRGFSIHILASMVFLWQYENLGTERVLSDAEKQVIDSAYSNLKKIAVINEDELIGITFRLGEGEAPMAVSHKRPPEVTWN
jgi:hypothetical protein